MSKIFSNIVAIRGQKELVSHFLQDALGTDVDLVCGDLEFPSIYLRDWIGGEDTPENNIDELSVEKDAPIVAWECAEDDEDDTIVIGYVTTEGYFPQKWIMKLESMYPALYFYIYTYSEDGAEYSIVKQDWEVEERIRPAYYPTAADKEFYDKESDKLLDRFYDFIQY